MQTSLLYLGRDNRVGACCQFKFKTVFLNFFCSHAAFTTWRSLTNKSLITVLHWRPKTAVFVGYLVTFIIDNNQRPVSKANLWIIHYCILEMKADNEPAISLSVSFKSIKKWKNILRKNKKTKQNKRTRNKGKKSFQRRESNPGPPRYLLPHDN